LYSIGYIPLSIYRKSWNFAWKREPI